MSDNPNDRFIKLMMMTTSDNDNEALIAIRKVNQMLKEKNITWEKLINTWTRNTPRPPQPPPPKQEPRREAYTGSKRYRGRGAEYIIMDDASEIFNNFFNDLKKKGNL